MRVFDDISKIMIAGEVTKEVIKEIKKSHSDLDNLDSKKPITKELKFTRVLNINALKQKEIFDLMMKQLEELEIRIIDYECPLYIKVREKIAGGFSIEITTKLTKHKNQLMISRIMRFLNLFGGFTERGCYIHQYQFESVCNQLEKMFNAKRKKRKKK